MEKRFSTNKSRWRDVFLWVGVIYLTLPVVRPICEFLKKSTPFEPLLNAVFIIIGAWGCVYFYARGFRVRSAGTFLLLCGWLAACFFLLGHVAYPEEKVHLLEYGFLAFLILRALPPDWNKLGAYIAAALLTALFGWIDEVIQHFLPNRYFQWSDVGLNSLSGLLGLWFVFVVLREIRFPVPPHKSR